MKKRWFLMTFMATLLLYAGFVHTAAAADSEYQIMFNGTYISLEGAQPQNVDGKVMAPFRATLEALGADVTWDQSSRTITAQKEDTILSFTMGQDAITVRENGQTRTVQMDVPPFIGTDATTYVDPQVIAEALGYKVGWDAVGQTVVIIDYASIFAQADEDFSILMKTMQTDAEDMEQAYETAGEFTAGMTLAEALTGTEEPVTITMNGSLTGLQKGLDAEMNMVLAFDLDDLLMGETADAETLQALEDLKNIEIAMKMDGATGDVYMNSPLFASYMGEEGIDANTWLKTNSYTSYEQMGIDPQTMMDMTVNPPSLYEILMFFVENSSAEITVDTYQETSAVYAVAKSILGDEAFTVQTVDGQTVYTNAINGTDIIEAMMKNWDLRTMLESMTNQDQNDLRNILSQMNLNLTLTEQEGKMIRSDMDLNIDLPELVLDCTMSSGETDATLGLILVIPDGLEILFDMNMVLQETDQEVDISLPPYAEILDIDAMPAVEVYDLETTTDGDLAA